MTSTIYVVWGDNGQSYSDHAEWTIAAYTDKAKAEEHARLAGEWLEENTTAYRYGYRFVDGTSPYDEKVHEFAADYTYSVSELPLRDAVPTL